MLATRSPLSAPKANKRPKKKRNRRKAKSPERKRRRKSRKRRPSGKRKRKRPRRPRLHKKRSEQSRSQKVRRESKPRPSRVGSQLTSGLIFRISEELALKVVSRNRMFGLLG